MFGIKRRVWRKIEVDIEKGCEQQKKSLQQMHQEKVDQYKKELIEKEYEYAQRKRRLDDEVERQLELKTKYEKASNELKEQLRILEAKASPDGVFIEAFGLGFSKAFDMMADVIGAGFRKSKELLVNRTRDEERAGVQKLVEARIAKLDSYTLKEKSRIEQKLKEFEEKKLQTERAKNEKAFAKYANLVEALKWVLYDEKS